MNNECDCCDHFRRMQAEKVSVLWKRSRSLKEKCEQDRNQCSASERGMFKAFDVQFMARTLFLLQATRSFVVRDAQSDMKEGRSSKIN